jgi:hypothetical protein
VSFGSANIRQTVRCLVTLQTSSHSVDAQCVARHRTEHFQLFIPAPGRIMRPAATFVNCLCTVSLPWCLETEVFCQDTCSYILGICGRQGGKSFIRSV